MRNHPELATVILILSLLILPANSLAQGLSSELNGEQGVMVGRISHVEGTVFRYVPEEGYWAKTLKDSPFGLEDKLRSDQGSRAEIILSNNTWFRMNDDTHLQLVSIQAEGTDLHMVHGIARFMSKGSVSTMNVSTPFGAVSAPAQASFDLYVGDTSMEVIALKGSVNFTRNGGWVRTEVLENSPSLIADAHFVTAGTAHRDAAWESWNLEREALWARNMRAGGVSAKYLPSTLNDHAYALDDYGTWQRVYYDGGYGYLWRPLYVSAGWAPYTVGTWALWYGDHTWIPYEPFGYVTHHYGSWVYTTGFWYWAPPVTSFTLQFAHPSLHIGVAWYPGRVAWLHRGLSIGWFPLAPYEPYYAHRRWGPRSVVVKDVTVVNLTVNTYRHQRHAVKMDRQKFHAADPYRNASIRSTARSTPVPRINSEPATVLRQGREAKPIFAPRSIENRRASSSAPTFDNRKRQDSLPGSVSENQRGRVSGDRTRDGRSDPSAVKAPTPVPQQENNAGKAALRNQSRSTALRTDSTPRRDTRQLPAGPRIEKETRQHPENSRVSSTVPQMDTVTTRATAPTPARVRLGPERSAGGGGAAIPSLPQPRARGLEQVRPETNRSPSARIQGQRMAPENIQTRGFQNSNRGRLFSR